MLAQSQKANRVFVGSEGLTEAVSQVGAYEIESLTHRVQKLHAEMVEVNRSLTETRIRVFGYESQSAEQCAEERDAPGDGLIALMRDALDLFSDQVSAARRSADRLARL